MDSRVMEFEIRETQWLGKEGYHYELLDSTNSKAKELAEAGCSHGTLVTAEEQEAGVGRRGRSWTSEKGRGVYMSLVLRPQIATDKASMLTLVAAVSVAKAIEALTRDSGLHPFIKWPNDIVVRGKKVCGILTEMALSGTEVGYIVVGIGINVYAGDFPMEFAGHATSIEAEAGYGISRERMAEMVLVQFEKYYALFMETQDMSLLMEDYQRLLANKGRRVTVLEPGGTYDGTARGITETGELIVDTVDGTKLVSAGEVSVRGIYGYV